MMGKKLLQRCVVRSRELWESRQGRWEMEKKGAHGWVERRNMEKKMLKNEKILRGRKKRERSQRGGRRGEVRRGRRWWGCRRQRGVWSVDRLSHMQALGREQGLQAKREARGFC